jgi:hypothetical protein
MRIVADRGRFYYFATLSPIELIELGTELVQAGTRLSGLIPLKRDHVARLDDSLGHLGGIEPEVGQNLGNTLSLQLSDHSVGHLPQAS